MSREISEFASIPQNYLSKILHGLRRAGFLEAARGKSGGYQLAKDPREIHLYEVVSLFDDVTSLNTCVLTGRPCARSCGVHRSWHSLALGVIDFLEKTTVAELGK